MILIFIWAIGIGFGSMSHTNSSQIEESSKLIKIYEIENIIC